MVLAGTEAGVDDGTVEELELSGAALDVPDSDGRVMVTPPLRQYDWAKARVAA